MKRCLIFAGIIILFSCSTNRELSLLDELTLIMKNTKSVEEATLKLKSFIDNKKETMKKIVEDFNNLGIEQQMERYLEFNRKLYDKDGFFEIIETKNYNKDDNFNEALEEFKNLLSPFFQKESKLGG